MAEMCSFYHASSKYRGIVPEAWSRRNVATSLILFDVGHTDKITAYGTADNCRQLCNHELYVFNGK